MPMRKRITMQDIADACGLSRNTVSKIFNGRGAVPEATRDFVLAKAQELGYHQLSEVAPTAPKNIALLTHSNPSLHTFGSLFITNFTDQICRSGYNLKIFEISVEDYASNTLPSHFVLSEISGIITLELFNRDYTQMICSLGIPTLLIDSYPDASCDLLQCDLLYMENRASTIALTNQMIEAGAKTIGFVGDYTHCNSFQERWYGYRRALILANLPYRPELCILADDSEPYGEVDWMLRQLDALAALPDAFVCCNDFIAIRLMQALRRKNISVPKDIMVTGFDGTTESEVVFPSLTTAAIPSSDMGKAAANIILHRITNPETPFQCSYIKTTPIYRDSTKK